MKKFNYEKAMKDIEKWGIDNDKIGVAWIVMIIINNNIEEDFRIKNTDLNFVKDNKVNIEELTKTVHQLKDNKYKSMWNELKEISKLYIGTTISIDTLLKAISILENKHE